MTSKSLQQDKTFGYFITGSLSFGVVFLALVKPNAVNIPVSIGVVLLAFIVALLCPKTYRPFRLAWFLFGTVAARIFNPLVLGILYFFLLTPMALIYGFTGKSHFKLTRGADSNWEVSDPRRKINFRSQF